MRSRFYVKTLNVSQADKKAAVLLFYDSLYCVLFLTIQINLLQPQKRGAASNRYIGTYIFMYLCIYLNGWSSHGNLG